MLRKRDGIRARMTQKAGDLAVQRIVTEQRRGANLIETLAADNTAS
jgi:hypothetical protein